MKSLKLNHFPYFDNSKALGDLNRLVGLYDNLMPHQVAAATGCRLQEAMGVLLLLVTQDVAEALVLAYHLRDDTDPPVPFIAQNIIEGLPKPPLLCDVCGNEIEDSNELSYDFLFKLREKVLFTL